VLAIDGTSLVATGALDGEERWRAAAPPREEWGASAAGDRRAWHDGDQLWAADAHGVELWHGVQRVLAGPVVMSADGALLAAGALCPYGGGFDLWDAATGKDLRSIKADGCAVAWDPASRRIAAWHAGAVEITDARTGAITVLGPRRAPDRKAGTVAWSRDGTSVAAAADGIVTLWKLGERDPVATFAPFGAGVAAVLRDGSIELLGDAADARGVLGCRIGAQLAPLDACAPRVP